MAWWQLQRISITEYLTEALGRLQLEKVATKCGRSGYDTEAGKISEVFHWEIAIFLLIEKSSLPFVWKQSIVSLTPCFHYKHNFFANKWKWLRSLAHNILQSGEKWKLMVPHPSVASWSRPITTHESAISVTHAIVNWVGVCNKA
jgi:hypothetical protein